MSSQTALPYVNSPYHRVGAFYSITKKERQKEKSAISSQSTGTYECGSALCGVSFCLRFVVINFKLSSSMPPAQIITTAILINTSGDLCFRFGRFSLFDILFIVSWMDLQVFNLFIGHSVAHKYIIIRLFLFGVLL